MNALLIAGSALFLLACGREPVEPDFSFSPPNDFPPIAYSNTNNPITEAGFELGRDLFYENALSADSTQNCASCHAQVHAFADHNVAFSTGVQGKLGKRNSPALVNIAWMPTFMWDGGIVHLDVMPLAPITDSLEMNLPLAEAVSRLQQSESYRRKFKRAFDVDSITSQELFFALSQYMNMLISDQSKYDKYLDGEEEFTSSQLAGLALFEENCSSCHVPPLFTDFSFARNGIETSDGDLGRGRITLLESDNGKFKVPSLRNVELTYPYMHDGRFFTLEAVVEHYSEHVDSDLADDRLGGPKHFTATEQQQLLDFLSTLTDYSYLANSTFSDPR